MAMAGCNQPSTKTPGASGTTDSAATGVKNKTISSLKAEPFAPPALIEGCTSLFAADSAGLQQQAYLFAAGVTGTAFVKLNGRLHQLARQHKNNNIEFIEETYTADGVTVTLSATPQQRAGDEVWLYKGTLLIKSNEEQITIPVWGEIGC